MLIQLLRWFLDPMKLYSCLNGVCKAYFSIASVFVISGLMPSLSTIYPTVYWSTVYWFLSTFFDEGNAGVISPGMRYKKH